MECEETKLTSPASDMPESSSPFDPHCTTTMPNGVANAFPWIKPARMPIYMWLIQIIVSLHSNAMQNNFFWKSNCCPRMFGIDYIGPMKRNP